MYNTIQISERIRAMRDLCGISVDEMAEATGVSPEEYIKCETGQIDFPFTFIYKCADRFGVDIVELITGENPRLQDYTVVHDGMGLPIKKQGGFEYTHLASNFKGKMSEPFLVNAPYREEEQDSEISLSQQEGQEFDYIISGSMKFKFEGHEENLIAGDSVYFDSSKPHGMIATSKDGCTFISVIVKGEVKK
ncbi:MAG: helix-turn-helix domain-containing protein [Candidatus Methanomethylophilaceae archaeon]|nr:helix-turn-helix domain-containing protein [Candidatus Methanomethylophilaceae archaeon]